MSRTSAAYAHTLRVVTTGMQLIVSAHEATVSEMVPKRKTKITSAVKRVTNFETEREKIKAY